MSDKNNDYEVGYGKPPKKRRFKKGRSGNPKGRPRKRKAETGSASTELGMLLREALGQKTNVKIKGESREMALLEIAAAALAKRVAEGDLQALKAAREIMRELDELEEQQRARERIENRGPMVVLLIWPEWSNGDLVADHLLDNPEQYTLAEHQKGKRKRGVKPGYWTPGPDNYDACEVFA